MSDKIIEVTRNSHEDILKITSLACGPSKEIFDVYQSAPEEIIERLNITLVDFDKSAINFLRKLKKEIKLKDNIKIIHENLLKVAMGKTPLILDENDLVYSLGLIDYFPDKIVIKFLNWIHQILKPGGMVILGNFHHRNSCKVLMDHILQWKLIHRDEEQIADLFKKSVFNRFPTRIYFENQGINIFAECSK